MTARMPPPPPPPPPQLPVPAPALAPLPPVDEMTPEPARIFAATYVKPPLPPLPPPVHVVPPPPAAPPPPDDGPWIGVADDLRKPYSRYDCVIPPRLIEPPPHCA